MSAEDPGELEPIDLQWVAGEWEELLSKIHYPSGLLAIDVLIGLVLSFGRGRGVRMLRSGDNGTAARWAMGVHLSVFQRIDEHSEDCKADCPRYVTLQTLWPEGLVVGVARSLTAERENSQ